MGLAPPLFLLCEEDYDANLGEGRRKWRRNRAVEEGGMGELLRPMDVFALLVACIGHDVGHPGLTNAYMVRPVSPSSSHVRLRLSADAHLAAPQVNARAPVAQVYDDKSILENFHTVTLTHMLRRHGFDYLLGGDFGHLGDQATPFRKIVEASILATDMSRHFAFVTEITDMGKRAQRKEAPSAGRDLEADRLLLCSGLIKCADISNPVRLLLPLPLLVPPCASSDSSSLPLCRLALTASRACGPPLCRKSGRSRRASRRASACPSPS